MKKLLLTALLTASFSLAAQQACATNLLGVYQQALKSDPTYQAAISQEMADREALPQSVALLLPQIGVAGRAGWNKHQTVGNNISASLPGHTRLTQKQRTNGFDVSLKQTIFNFSYWKQLSQASYAVKASSATLNAQSQDLMSRTVGAYLAVLDTQDILRYTSAEKKALYQEYLRANQSFKVGIKTITDVYNAKAAYDGSVAQYVVAKNSVENAKENLRVITGERYSKLSTLQRYLPLSVPTPKSINEWVNMACQHNWTLLAARYAVLSARENIHAKSAGHLPTLDLSANYSNGYAHTINEGNQRVKGPSAELEVNLPVFTGGSVVSQAKQAVAQFEVASHNQEQTHREVINQTRQAYLGVVSGISKVRADKQVVISNSSSLRGTKEGYKVGTRTMIDVLNAQKALYASQRDYATDRYNYILSIITLKEAAGTLNENDLRTLNQWLK